jgi:hypothetical protein
LHLAIVLVGGLEGRDSISVSVLEGQAEWPHAYILQLRCVKSGDQFSNQSMGDMMFVCVSSPVAAKRTCYCRVEGNADYKEHKLCFLSQGHLEGLTQGQIAWDQIQLLQEGRLERGIGSHRCS